MSLYNMLNGIHPSAEIVISLLNTFSNDENFSLANVRFRDAYLKNGQMIMLTRTGGGNREKYCNENNVITNHPLYIKNHDDDYDSTYALWYFKYPDTMPNEVREELDSLEKEFPYTSLKEKSEDVIGKLKMQLKI